MKETKIYCNGCGKEVESKEVGFFGDIFLKEQPDIQFCKGCASLICREVFDDFFNDILAKEYRDQDYDFILKIREKLILWTKKSLEEREIF